MPQPKPTLPPTAQPQLSNNFDPWNSSSTGHQRAENRLGGSTGWRQSRTAKLSSQFKSGGTGGKRMSDKVGAGSEDYDENLKTIIPKYVRERAKRSIGDLLTGKGKRALWKYFSSVANQPAAVQNSEEVLMVQRKQEEELREEGKPKGERGVFDGLVIYINGSTYPLISDHKLKQLLAENGARLSIHLGRRTVTHVILGRPTGTEGQGAGGGLAGTKIEKEIKRIGGCGVKYVGVEW